jgi:C1A family cysteine protease
MTGLADVPNRVKGLFPATRTVRRYGWTPDLPDHRDLPFVPRRTARKTLPKLPTKMDLRLTGFMPGVYDQDGLGSCTSNGVGGVFEYIQRMLGYTDYMPGRLFIYFEERRIIDTIGYDSGAFIRDGLRVVNRLGAPHENLWPYNVGAFTQQPNSESYIDALKHQATAYLAVDNKREYDVKAAIAQGLPVVFGFTVFPWFENPTADGFCIPIPGQGVLGGHCVVVVGYFLHKHTWWAIIRNSWGEGWGVGGYCFMPLRWICDYANADDFWVISQVEPDELQAIKDKQAKKIIRLHDYEALN